MKNIMLAVCGMSPQVITEAMYSLFIRGDEVDALHIITTRMGRERIDAGLLSSKQNRLELLLTQFGKDIEKFEFDPKTHIHSICDERGFELKDIVTTEDNDLLLNLCLSQSFQHTSSEETRVWFLVAGGRKTMTSCLTLAAQIYGRKQDRLLHVLVSPPDFETCADFWFPTAQPTQVEIRGNHGKAVRSTDEAQIDLLSIPFYSMRGSLSPQQLKKAPENLEALPGLIRDEPSPIQIHLQNQTISYRGKKVELTFNEMAVYAYLAEYRSSCFCREGYYCFECVITLDHFDDKNNYDKILRLRKMISLKNMASTKEGGKHVESITVDKYQLSTHRTHINKKMEKVFGRSLSQKVLIKSQKNEDKETCYFIAASSNLLKIETD